MSWELITTNPANDMFKEDIFRLEELYDENKDKTITYTDDEINVIKMLLNKSGDI